MEKFNKLNDCTTQSILNKRILIIGYQFIHVWLKCNLQHIPSRPGFNSIKQRTPILKYCIVYINDRKFTLYIHYFYNNVESWIDIVYKNFRLSNTYTHKAAKYDISFFSYFLQYQSLCISFVHQAFKSIYISLSICYKNKDNCILK